VLTFARDAARVRAGLDAFTEYQPVNDRRDTFLAGS